MKKILFNCMLLFLAMLITVSAAACSPKAFNGTSEFGNGSGTLDETLSIPDDEAYDGYFEGDTVEVTVECISGTPDCYTLEGNVLTFTELSEDSVYSVSGRLKGSIVVDAGDYFKLDIELCGFSLISDTVNPITVKSGDEVTLTAKKNFENYIYDMREAVESDGESVFSGAIHSEVDLEIAGKGALTVVSENNNGIHSKNDLLVKNLSLTVLCTDNALKGNDSVSIEGGVTQLVATQGDGIKTSNSDISEKGNQRGTISITGGTHVVGAACDGIDAAYDVIIDDESTDLTVYTDKYSSYSEEVTATAENIYYLRYTRSAYKFSVKYYNSDEDYLWVNVSDDYETVTTSGNRPGSSGTTYYYYTFDKKPEYAKLKVYMYELSQEQGQEKEYYACSSYQSLNEYYDTVSVSYSNGSLSFSWSSYTTQSSSTGGWGGMGRPGGMGGPGGTGGMDGGNTDKGDYSTKGIKAGNQIIVNGGKLSIKAYDDAIHANAEGSLENGETPTGNVTVNGGTLVLYSNDDAIHADGILSIAGGSVTVESSYEGLEGAQIKILDGKVSAISSDDGMNSTATSGTGIEISGGSVYVYAGGDGLDSNTRTSYTGIVFSGGETVVISNSSGNSALDTENGYSYSGGSAVAIMPQRGMASESVHCENFSGIGAYKTASLSSGDTVRVTINGSTVSVVMPCSMSAYVIAIGDSSASVTVK